MKTKMLFVMLLTLAATLILSAAVQAQSVSAVRSSTIVPTATANSEANTIVWLGGQYQKHYGVDATAGGAVAVGSGFWWLFKGSFGDPGATIEPQGAFFYEVSKVFSVGAAAGPGVNWDGTESLLTRILGAGTVIVSGMWDKKNPDKVKSLGFMMAYTYRTNFKKDDGYKDGPTFCAAATAGF